MRKASEEGLAHRERHAAVEYVVAHGIASSIDGKRVIIGSEHFVVDDEGVQIDRRELDLIHRKANGASPLFLAVEGKLKGVIYLEDPLKPEIAETIEALRAEGFEKIVMLTGDDERSAARTAQLAGVDEYRANMLPEDKYAYIVEAQRSGKKIVMVGDGVNDSPALAAAHVSIAMGAGSDIAREAADVALTSDDLRAIIDLRRISRALQKRMRSGYRFTIAFNSILLALGIAGALTPQLSSALHNSSTVLLSAANARAFLPKGENR